MGLIKLLGHFASKQFQKTPTGYVYRYNAKGPPVAVTADDYDHYVRRAGWSFIFHCAGFMLAVIAAAMLTERWFPNGDEAGGMVLMGLLLVGIVFGIIKSLAWSMRAPERELGAAPQGDVQAPTRPQRPAGGRKPPKAERHVSGWVFLFYFIAEIVAGAVIATIAYSIFKSNQDLAIAAGFIGFGAGMFIVDHICVRRTGESVLSNLPYIP
ncbi:hypothetical protein [Sphingomonas sp. Y38-1Y]|uniref:hypothetical protein n=1 Tax=Sphingomonas sp. Y38-1Y TaxID=3078265 RepID=UPI0028E5AAA4|nr:hypothetical protein [Sphingomonas sp. Y38-1Y]